MVCHTANRSHRVHLHRGDCQHVAKGELISMWDHCSACHDGQAGHRVHTRRGNCRLAGVPRPQQLQLADEGARSESVLAAASTPVIEELGDAEAPTGQEAPRLANEAAIEQSATTSPVEPGRGVSAAPGVLGPVPADRQPPDSFESLEQNQHTPNLDGQSGGPALAAAISETSRPGGPALAAATGETETQAEINKQILAQLELIRAELSHYTMRVNSLEGAVEAIRLELGDAKDLLGSALDRVELLEAKNAAWEISN